MSKHTTLHLTREEISQLEKLVRSGNAPARTQTKARLLLLTDRSTGMARNDAEVAMVLMVSSAHVGRIRRTFIKDGMNAALYDQPRSGGKPKITGDIEAKMIMLACSNPPEGHDRWTVQLIRDTMIELQIIDSISRVAVGNHLKKSIKALEIEVMVHR